MAAVLFLENREKTGFWAQVALQLRQQGHQIHWMVQNPWFLPPAFRKSPQVHVLPYPRGHGGAQGALSSDQIARDYPELANDRGRLFFEAGAVHYAPYTAAIERLLEDIRPDMVVGESTLFHELITIRAARVRRIPYLHPCANRYPSGRFSLFAYDTQHPVAGSQDVWPQAQAQALAERISTGAEIPFYMRTPGLAERLAHRSRWLGARARVWAARMSGERYNTPSLRRKIELQRQVARNLDAWAVLASQPRDPAQAILYPLQLQPETNIDVWGRPHADQVAMVRALLEACPARAQVAVKANPKAKYEVSDALIALAREDARVCLLPVDMPMAQAQRHTMGSVTVSGTVGMEALFGRGRCLSLSHPLIENEFPEFHAVSPQDAARRLFESKHAGRGNVALGAQLIQCMVRDSFPGLVSDPLSHPHVVEPGNVKAVAGALGGVLQRPFL